MQATLHQERIWRQDQEALCAKIEAEKLQIQNTRNSLEAKLKVLINAMLLDFNMFFCTVQLSTA